MARKIEGRAAVEISVDERGMIIVTQRDEALQQDNQVELTHFDVPVFVQMVKEAATEAKAKGRPA